MVEIRLQERPRLYTWTPAGTFPGGAAEVRRRHDGSARDGRHRVLLDRGRRDRAASVGRLERRRTAAAALLLHGSDGPALSSVHLHGDDRRADAVHGSRLCGHLQRGATTGA